MSDVERASIEALRFSVRYRLPEYVAFAVAHALDTDDFVRAAPRWKQHLFSTLLAAIACATFAWKSLRIGRCDFRIDGVGIERRSRRGVSGVPWTRVRAVHVYPRGYLIELEHGAMPVPFRALPDGGRRRLEAFAGALSGSDAAVSAGGR